mmetsp:Transcript_120910/g.376546  ORF Transcript_120910/g.376546 Transcript_120910/m.376546 type:complete len:547 (+) Transcript_120910:87-1727(+)
MVKPGVYCILVETLLGSLATFTIVPLIPFLAMQMGANAFQVSVLGPSFYISQMCCCAVVGAMSDRFGRKRVNFSSCICQAIGNLALSRVETVPMLFFANLLRGASLSAASSDTAYLMESAESEEDLGRILALSRFALSLGALGGPILARILAPRYTFKSLVHGAVSINLLNALLAALFLSEPGHGREGAGDAPSPYSISSPSSDVTPASEARAMRSMSIMASIARIFQRRSRAMLLVCWFIFSFSGGICDGPEMVLFRDHFGFTTTQACEFFTISTLSSIIGTTLVHPLMHGIGRYGGGLGAHAVCVLGAVCSSVATMGIILLRHYSWTPYAYGVFCAGFAGSMFSLGFMQFAQKVCSRAALGTFLGISQAMGSAGVTLGPFLGGVLYGFNNFAPPFVTSIFFAVAAVMVAYLLGETTDKKASLEAACEDDSVSDLLMYSMPLQPVMANKTFATMIAVQEVAHELDPDMTLVYQAYQSQLNNDHRCFSVAGDRLVSPALRNMRMEEEDSAGAPRVRRALTERVRGHRNGRRLFHLDEESAESSGRG